VFLLLSIETIIIEKDHMLEELYFLLKVQDLTQFHMKTQFALEEEIIVKSRVVTMNILDVELFLKDMKEKKTLIVRVNNGRFDSTCEVGTKEDKECKFWYVYENTP
jgi:hypothetical protein